VGASRQVTVEPTFEAWQAEARRLLAQRVPPDEVVWTAAPDPARRDRRGPATGRAPGPGVVRVPRRFLELARQVAGHADPERWGLLYEVLWRVVHEGRGFLESPSDPRVRRLLAMAAQARRAAYREEVAEMRRVEKGATAAPFVPAGASLDGLRTAAAACTGCELYRRATQTVFGQGPPDARIVLVGEQPGDQEDLRGAPFVGPAGEVLDRALAEVGLDRRRLYVTNAVKHFKFVERGTRRIHQKPRLGEIAACRPWLEAELGVIHPEVLVCLGATAAAAVFGPQFRLLRDRGRFLPTRWTAKTMATIHPSAVLRGEDDDGQQRLYRMFADDLGLVAAAAA
jgi:DNA polymerase